MGPVAKLVIEGRSWLLEPAAKLVVEECLCLFGQPAFAQAYLAEGPILFQKKGTALRVSL